MARKDFQLLCHKKIRLHAILPPMSRKLLSLLIVIVTLQFSWLALAGYCEHETGRAAQHFGHHQHTESPDELASLAKDKSSLMTKKFSAHAHCASCAHITIALPGLESVALHPIEADSVPQVRVTAFSSAYQPPPERPQWIVAV